MKASGCGEMAPCLIVWYYLQAWRAAALDYEDRFVGHLNTKTDIKEANYFGDANYIVAG